MAKKRKERKFLGKDQVTVITRTARRTGKTEPKAFSNLQVGDVIPNIPASPLGTSIGTILGLERKPGMHVHYEQAECPCNGNNERCSRCDGTGYYTKEIVDQFIGTPSTPWIK